MTNEEQINVLADAFKKFGINSGDVLMVHSSLSSLGHIEGGVNSVIAALLKVLGDKGTLLMPALSYENVSRDNPYFDVNETPCCVGTIPETFRHYPGTIRSLHPTHSICANGYRAREFTEKHYLDRTPVGSNSPLALLRDAGGKILMIGCGLYHNTSMHGVEETVGTPYLFENEKCLYTLVDENGNKRRVSYTNHGFENVDQHYERAANLLTGDELKKGNVLEAECFLIDSKALWKKGHDALRENALYFVSYRK